MERRVLACVALSTLMVVNRSLADGIAERVDRLEQEVAAHAQRVQTLETHASSTSTQITQILIGLTTQSQQITTLAGHVAAVSGEVNALGQEAAGLKERLGALEQKVMDLKAVLDARIEGLGARIDALEARVGAIETGPPAGPAPVITVDCDAGQTIPDAIARLNRGPHVLKVSGACGNPVSIASRDDLTLIAEPDASLSALTVFSSRNVRVTGFRLRGGGTAITIDRGSIVELRDITIEEAATGISVSSSQVFMATTRVLRPTVAGIVLADRSVAHIQHTLLLQGTQPGIGQPSSVGLNIIGGSRARLDTLEPDSVIYDFATGVRVSENSSLSVLIGDSPTALLKIWRNATGMNVVSSTAGIVGNVVFDNNARCLMGTDGGRISLSGGVAFTGLSPTGLSLVNGSSARAGSRVTFNVTGTAVDLTVNSSVVFFNSQVTFNGNFKDVVCDAYSVAGGVWRTNAVNISCPNLAN